MIDHLMPDIPRLYSAIAEWLACMIFILPFKKRFSKIKTGVIMAVMLVVQSGFMVVTEDVSLFFWIPCMMVAVFLMLFFIYVSCAIEITDAVYFVLIAFVVAEFMASIEWQVACYFRIAQSGVWWREWLALILGYGIISVILFKILHVHFPEDGQIEIGWKECLSAFLIAISVFAVSNISYLTINTPFSGRYSFEIANIRTIVDLAGIAILYAHLMQCCELRARKELEAVQNVLQNQYAQYVLGKVYMMEKEVEQDKEKAYEYFRLAAEQGNVYAVYFLEHWNDMPHPDLLLMATRLMHHLENILKDDVSGKKGDRRTGMDRKLARKIRQKKIAQGHARDDREEMVQTQ